MLSGSSTYFSLWLRVFLKRYDAVAGTIHIRQGDSLVLQTALNLPPAVEKAVQSVPHGKGMAGLAWSRDEPVSTCNLKTDSTGDVRPGAKAVNAEAAVALPVHNSQKEVRAVVGIAFRGEREISEDELHKLTIDAEQLPGL